MGRYSQSGVVGAYRRLEPTGPETSLSLPLPAELARPARYARPTTDLAATCAADCAGAFWYVADIVS